MSIYTQAVGGNFAEERSFSTRQHYSNWKTKTQIDGKGQILEAANIKDKYGGLTSEEQNSCLQTATIRELVKNNEGVLDTNIVLKLTRTPPGPAY